MQPSARHMAYTGPRGWASRERGRNHDSENAQSAGPLPRRAPPRRDRRACRRHGLRAAGAGLHQFPAAHLGWRRGLRPHHGIRLPAHLGGDRAAAAVRVHGDRAGRQAGPRLVVEIRRRRPQRLRAPGAHRRHEREGPGGRHSLFSGLCRLCQCRRDRPGEGAGAVGIPHLGAHQLRVSGRGEGGARRRRHHRRRAAEPGHHAAVPLHAARRERRLDRGRAGERRAQGLRQSARRDDQRADLRLAPDQPEELREDLAGQCRTHHHRRRDHSFVRAGLRPAWASPAIRRRRRASCARSAT